MSSRARKLDDQLDFIELVSDRAELMPMWREVFDVPPPAYISLKMMKLAVGYKLQERVHGGLKPAIVRHLYAVVAEEAKAGSPPEDRVPPGTHLIRQWHGTIYEAVVEASGVVVNGQRYGSLSDAASAITGVKWSGPRFFGLRKVKSK